MPGLPTGALPVGSESTAAGAAQRRGPHAHAAPLFATCCWLRKLREHMCNIAQAAERSTEQAGLKVGGAALARRAALPPGRPGGEVGGRAAHPAERSVCPVCQLIGLQLSALRANQWRSHADGRRASVGDPAGVVGGRLRPAGLQPEQARVLMACPAALGQPGVCRIARRPAGHPPPAIAAAARRWPCLPAPSAASARWQPAARPGAPQPGWLRTPPAATACKWRTAARGGRPAAAPAGLPHAAQAPSGCADPVPWRFGPPSPPSATWSASAAWHAPRWRRWQSSPSSSACYRAWEHAGCRACRASQARQWMWRTHGVTRSVSACAGAALPLPLPPFQSSRPTPTVLPRPACRGAPDPARNRGRAEPQRAAAAPAAPADSERMPAAGHPAHLCSAGEPDARHAARRSLWASRMHRLRPHGIGCKGEKREQRRRRAWRGCCPRAACSRPSQDPPSTWQAAHLTALTLVRPFPEDSDFFGHLAAATQLRSLRISTAGKDEPTFTSDEEAEALLCQALGSLTGLTALAGGRVPGPRATRRRSDGGPAGVLRSRGWAAAAVGLLLSAPCSCIRLA